MDTSWWDRLREAFEPPRSYTSGIEWVRDTEPEHPADQIQREDPTWKPPPDPWRPDTTLGGPDEF